MNTALSMRIARVEEAEVVSSILIEAADWLARRGEPLWSRDELLADAIRPEVSLGYWVLAFAAHDAVGVARLTLDDRVYWPDQAEGDALYVHRLAVRRAQAGGTVSRALLDWVSERASELGRDYVRLDCRADRPRLRSVYDRFGFEFHSERAVGPFLAARYQKATKGRRAS